MDYMKTTKIEWNHLETFLQQYALSGASMLMGNCLRER